jgi:hypothetical protein
MSRSGPLLKVKVAWVPTHVELHTAYTANETSPEYADKKLAVHPPPYFVRTPSKSISEILTIEPPVTGPTLGETEETTGFGYEK